MVKFSYPPDGNAHFSQDGKVYTKVRKVCPPINKIEGHFFTVQIQGLDFFEQFELGNEKTSNPKQRSFIEAKLGNKTPPAIKIVGMLYSRANLRSRSPSQFAGPIIDAKDTAGNLRKVCICAPPIETGVNADINLLLSCEPIPLFNKTKAATLFFSGGFDERSVVEDWTKDTTFLALVYPAQNVAELTQTIGSIDFNRSSSI